MFYGRNRFLIAGLALAAGVGLAVATPLAGNLWDLLTGVGYEIPAESSVFSFRATVMNEGSGEWWMYGEDGRNFYGVPVNDAGTAKYLVFPREKAAGCRGFDAHDTATWCPDSTRPGAG